LSSSERNREHAKRCRSRKKNYLKSLEDSVVELKSENEQLRRLMMMKFSREELASFLKDRPTTTAADRFTAALMKKPDVAAPLSNATDYLHSLREGCGEV
jgi:bZIP transcription factor